MKSDKKKDSENLRKKALRHRTSLETKKVFRDTSSSTKKVLETLQDNHLKRQQLRKEARYIYPSPDLVEMLMEQVRELEKLCEQIHLWKTDKYGMNRAGLDEFGGNR